MAVVATKVATAPGSTGLLESDPSRRARGAICIVQARAYTERMTSPRSVVIRAADLQEDAMREVVLRLIVQSSAVVLLAACASSNAPSASRHDVDFKRVGLIESAARHDGVSVVWINYPRKTGP